MGVISPYLRESFDRSGNEVGVNRQLVDLTELITSKGHEVGPVFCDNSLSAWNPEVIRGDFEAMTKALEAREIDGMASWNLDRYTRQPIELERLIKLYANVSLVFLTKEGEIDLSTPQGQFVARILVSHSNMSSQDTSRRIKDYHRHKAINGEPVGAWRPFGWQNDKITLDPAEHRLKRDALDALFAGITPYSIAQDWKAKGIKTPRGNDWSRKSFVKMMTWPRQAGYRVYLDEIAIDADGTPVVGKHQPAFTVEEYEKVCALLKPNGTKKNLGSRKHAVSGLLTCAKCGSLMWANAKTTRGDNGQVWESYTFICNPSTGGCGKNAISGPKTEATLTELALAYLADRRVVPEKKTWPDQAELDGVVARIGELMAAYRSGKLAGEIAIPNVNELQTRRKTLDRAKKVWLREHAAPVVEDVPANWERMTVEQKAAVFAKLFTTVMIKPASKPRGRFDVSRIEAIWRPES